MPACLRACLPACLPACLLACLRACLPACLCACLPACLCACLPRPTSGCRIGPAFYHNTEYQHVNTDLLFRLRFIHCTMVTPFILPCCLSLWLVNKKVRNCWRDISELYSFYLLHHSNGQTHVCLIASSVKIITKCVAVVYRFKSARMVSCWGLYACSWAVICQYSWC